MINRILERLEEKAVVNPIGGKLVKYVCISDIIDVVREVEKEYAERTCHNCKYETTPGDFEPCCVCRNAYSDDCFEPKDAPYQKGE